MRDYLTSRGSSLQVPLDRLPTLSEEIGAQSQGWRWTQSTGDSTRIEVSAGGFEQGADGQETVLRSVVLKLFHEESGKRDRVDSAEMRMLAGGELFSEGKTIITLGISDASGAEPVVAHATGVTFQPSHGSARTDSPVRYEFKDGRGSSTGAHYDASTGTLRMLSDVRLERFGRGSGTPSTVEAAGLLYQEGMARIDLTGGVSVRQGGRQMVCESAILWLAQGRVAQVDGVGARGGERTLGRTTAFSAPQVEAAFGSEGELLRVQGRGETRFESTESGQRVIVQGQAVDMRFDAGPESGASWLRTVQATDSARAGMQAEGSGTRTTVLSDELVLGMRPGSGEIERVETLQRGMLRQDPVSGSGPRRTLEADRIHLVYGEGSQVRHLEASGAASLAQMSGEPGEPVLRTWSNSLRAELDSATSEIHQVRQGGMFRFEEVHDGSPPARHGSADEAVFGLGGGQITLEGSAVAYAGGTWVSADQIVMDRQSGRLIGRGSVAVHISPGDGGSAKPAATGLFAGQEPLYATANALESDPESDSIEYRGAARLWQGTSRIDADFISAGGDPAALRARGSVTASWTDQGASGSPQAELSEVAADEMVYEEFTGEAVFRRSVDFRRGGMRALSDELRTSMGAASGGRPASAVATGNVRILTLVGDAGTRASGDRAEFLLADSEVTLTGSPARILGPGEGETRGGRLTFRATDDSLQVLGRGAERAYTYRPASQ